MIVSCTYSASGIAIIVTRTKNQGYSYVNKAHTHRDEHNSAAGDDCTTACTLALQLPQDQLVLAQSWLSTLTLAIPEVR